MHLELLPGSNGLTLCLCEAERMEPVAVVPIEAPELWCWSHDRSHIAVVDQASKRVTTFRVEGQELVRTMAPRTLPRDVRVHCIAMKGDPTASPTS